MENIGSHICQFAEPTPSSENTLSPWYRFFSLSLPHPPAKRSVTLLTGHARRPLKSKKRHRPSDQRAQNRSVLHSDAGEEATRELGLFIGAVYGLFIGAVY